MTKEKKRQLMREWRLAANEKLKDMSVFLNVPASSLCQIEKGRANMRDDVFYRYAEKYGKINTDIVMESKSYDSHEEHVKAHNGLKQIENELKEDVGGIRFRLPDGLLNLQEEVSRSVNRANKIDKIYESVMESQKKMNEMHALLKSIFE